MEYFAVPDFIAIITTCLFGCVSIKKEKESYNNNQLECPQSRISYQESGSTPRT